MEMNCEGCAGCCVDWRPLASVPDDERRGRYRPVDDVYNLAVLTRDDVRAFVEAGLGDAMAPRLFRAGPDSDRRVAVGDHELAAIDGRPAFFVGLRKLPKPVAPFGTDPAWLPACAFLDPETLQCRIHGDDLYPADCAEYPGHELALGRETECERVEDAFGGERLLDDEPPETGALLLGSGAVGGKVFVYPAFDDPPGGHAPVTPAVVERAAAGDLDAADRARFVAAAAASAPGSAAVDRDAYGRALDRVRASDSWVGRAAAEWAALADGGAPDPSLGRAVEGERGAPPTPGW